MSETNFYPIATSFYRNTDAQFWLLQLLGWFGLSLISFFSLTLWFDQQGELTYILHTLVQSALGIIVSWPLRSISRHIWNMRFWRRFGLLFSAIFVCSGIWAFLRLSTFMAMTGEQNLWPDFGGWLFGSIIIFVSWAAFYHGIKYYQLLQAEHSSLLTIAAANKEEQLKRATAETIAHEAQLKMLRYQLNPHFLFNTLNAVSSLVQDKKVTRANGMIVQLSNFLRHSLYSDPVRRVTLKEELDAVHLYLNIEQERFRDRLALHFEISEDAQEVKVPSLILQPLVENAIKYAIAPFEEGGIISIVATRDDDYLVLELSDTGPGITKWHSNETPKLGVGLRNTIDRLHAFYGESYEFKIENKFDKGTRVQMKVPFEKREVTVLKSELNNG
jgi:signal transduction histidine kinase